MKREIENPYQDGLCFYCGPNNQDGLKLKFYLDEETGEVSTEYLPSAPFIGQGQILHGGIMIGLLDEIMGWMSHVGTGEMAVTSDIRVEFLRPVYLGIPVRVTCRVTSTENPRIHMEAEIVNGDGVVCSRATGTYHALARDRYDGLINGHQQRIRVRRARLRSNP